MCGDVKASQEFSSSSFRNSTANNDKGVVATPTLLSSEITDAE
jgi:hypothetical protein